MVTVCLIAVTVASSFVADAPGSGVVAIVLAYRARFASVEQARRRAFPADPPQQHAGGLASQRGQAMR